MPGRFLIAEEYRRLLCEFAATIAPDWVRDGATAKDADYDPLRHRPVTHVASCIKTLMGVSTDVPIEWRLGEYLAANSGDLLTARALRSATLGEALAVSVQHQTILTNTRTISHRSRSDGELTETHIGANSQDPTVRFLFHSVLASKLAHLFNVYSKSESQHRIDLQARCFGSLMQRFDRELDFVDVDYRETEITLGFTRESLTHKLSDRDDRLIAALDRELSRKTANIPTTACWKDRIKYHIQSNHLSNISLDEICDTFHVQRRTLGRQLRNEGTTFTNILTELRRERALHLVRHTGAPLKRVAAELGFNSGASFNMAFKSWTGTTPMKFRKSASVRPAANDAQPSELAFAAEPKKGLRVGPLLASWSTTSRLTKP